jgi:hypothetical protein
LLNFPKNFREIASPIKLPYTYDYAWLNLSLREVHTPKTRKTSKWAILAVPIKTPATHGIQTTSTQNPHFRAHIKKTRFVPIWQKTL